MAKLPIDDVRHARPPASPIVEATLALVQASARAALERSGLDWDGFALHAADDLVTIDDMTQVEARLLSSGYRFDWSAAISVAERPDAYKPAAGATENDAGFAHTEAQQGDVDSRGYALRGQGDNVVRYAADVVGTARYIRSNDRVLDLLTNGVPPGTIAVIDDSGGTLTAPIIEQFAGVICAGGTVRSHLGILTREYGIPCLMNAKIAGIRDGDRVAIEASADAKTTEDYQQGVERTGRVWLIEGGGMNDRDLVLHGTAIKRHAPAAAIAELMMLPEPVAAALLAEAVATGRAVEAKGAYALTPLAGVAIAARYGLHYGDLRRDARFAAAYEGFERINVALKQLITDWQTITIGGSRVANDHSDKAHDAAVIDRLGDLHEQADPILAALAASLPRMEVYGRKLIHALEAAEDGDHAWVSDIRRDSYHTVWFELHEDLLRIMGREREE